MDPILLDRDLPPLPAASARWRYWRPALDGVVELGTLHGHAVGLPPHFHDEAQLTFVLSGRRRFRLGGGLIALAPGQGVLIPAFTPHSSAAEPAGVVCLNAYLPAADYAAAAMLAEIERLWRRTGRIGGVDLAAMVRAHAPSAVVSTSAEAAPGQPIDGNEPIGQVARRAGMSREGFSRRFAKRFGMPPHAYWLAGRLNQARRLLREGEALAAVAAETGFADQSHFGRWFRRAFGVTPGRYRAG